MTSLAKVVFWLFNIYFFSFFFLIGLVWCIVVFYMGLIIWAQRGPFDLTSKKVTAI